MRIKIISVYAVIVAICGLLSFFIVRQTIMRATTSHSELAARAQDAATSAAARLQLEALLRERWLGAKAQEQATRDALSKPTSESRSDAATTLSDAILNAAKSSSGLGGTPAMVLVVDTAGRIVGRNGSSLSRGEDLSAAYPSMRASIAKGSAGSDVGSSKDRSDLYVVSFSPIRDDAGKLMGALLIGLTISDQLAHVSAAVGNSAVALADESKIAGSFSVKDDFSGKDEEQKKAIQAGVVGVAKAALAGGAATFAESQGLSLASAPLESVGDGKRIAVVVVGPATLVEGLGGVAYAVLGVTALGLLMVIAAGIYLANYISKPIDTLEEGLLAIINGQEDKRFNLEHPEFGGLAFRIDQLLNKLAGITEDNTDAEGRVTGSSLIPAAAFRDVMMDRQPTIDSEADAARLASMPVDAYYTKLFADYIAAKRALGEATDHITADTFRARIQSMEQDAQQKHGKPVRYRAQSDGQTVSLLAIPLA